MPISEARMQGMEKQYQKYWGDDDDFKEIDVDLANSLADEVPILIAEVRKQRELLKKARHVLGLIYEDPNNINSNITQLVLNEINSQLGGS